MRRDDKAIEDTAINRLILKKAKYITIAMAHENEPYLVSLNHAYDAENDQIYFHCASSGKKLDYMKSTRVVWGQALLDYGFFGGSSDCRQNYASVMFKGRVSFVSDLDEKKRAFQLTNEGLNTPSQGLLKVLDSNLERVTVGRISLDYVSGKKSKEISVQQIIDT